MPIGALKSDVHANLEAAKMFSEMWWCTYCFCCGRGIGDIGNPLIGGEQKQLCINGKCKLTTDDIADPLCGGMEVFCCITRQFRFPPMKDTPICVCCNKELVGKAGSGWQPQLFEFKPAWGDQFWLVYLFCCGSGIHAPGANSRPLLGVQSKLLCIEEAVKLAPPIEDGIFCAQVSTVLCFWDQCAMPPAEGNPGFKCCGFPKKAGQNVSPMGYGKPGQVEMS